MFPQFLIQVLIFYSCSLYVITLSIGNRRSKIVFDENSKPQKILNENCVCVYHYLCGRDYFLITNGSGLLDERIGAGEPPKTPCENPAQICCFVRNGTVISTYPPIVEQTTVPVPETTVPVTELPSTTVATTTVPTTEVPSTTVAATTVPTTEVPSTTIATTIPTTIPTTTRASPSNTIYPSLPLTLPTNAIIIFLTLPPAQTIPTGLPPTSTTTVTPATIPTAPPPTEPTTTPTTTTTTVPTTTEPPTTTSAAINFPDDTTVAPTTQPPTDAPTTQPPSDAPTTKPTSNSTVVPGSRCGLQFTTPQREVVFDAYTASFAEYPWMLALLDSTAISVDGTIIKNAFICGASLLTNRIAMTAAHCIKNRTEESLIIRAGEWNTLFVNETLPHQDRSIQKIAIHEEYDNRTLYNDIALLKMQEPVVFAENVAPVCLPEKDAKFVDCIAIATGWGRNSFGPSGKFQTKMRKVSLPIITNDKCQTLMRENTRLGVGFNLHESFLCAGGQESLDTCTGDGGGPLVCKSELTNTFTQVGITSWGIGCGKNNVPGVYVDVAYNIGWIEYTLYNFARDSVPK